MVLAVPIVTAQPISMWQESFYVPQTPRILKTPAEHRLPGIKKPIRRKKKQPVYRGTASWYSETDPGINLRTANNEIFDDSKLTCASWYFPFGTYLKVENEANGESVICRVNDRGYRVITTDLYAHTINPAETLWNNPDYTHVQ